MPTISTQTDECVDVISRLNDEYDELAKKYDIICEAHANLLKSYQDTINLLHDVEVEVCEPHCWIQNTKCRCGNSRHAHKIKSLLQK